MSLTLSLGINEVVINHTSTPSILSQIYDLIVKNVTIVDHIVTIDSEAFCKVADTMADKLRKCSCNNKETRELANSALWLLYGIGKKAMHEDEFYTKLRSYLW